VTPLFAIPCGLDMTNLVGLLSRKTNSASQGETLGISSSVQSLAQGLPAVISGFIAVIFAPAVTLVIAATIMIISGVYFILKFPTNTDPAPV
jgi:hypothetical protein